MLGILQRPFLLQAFQAAQHDVVAVEPCVFPGDSGQFVLHAVLVPVCIGGRFSGREPGPQRIDGGVGSGPVGVPIERIGNSVALIELGLLPFAQAAKGRASLPQDPIDLLVAPFGIPGRPGPGKLLGDGGADGVSREPCKAWLLGRVDLLKRLFRVEGKVAEQLADGGHLVLPAGHLGLPGKDP